MQCGTAMIDMIKTMHMMLENALSLADDDDDDAMTFRSGKDSNSGRQDDVTTRPRPS